MVQSRRQIVWSSDWRWIFEPTNYLKRGLKRFNRKGSRDLRTDIFWGEDPAPWSLTFFARFLRAFGRFCQILDYRRCLVQEDYRRDDRSRREEEERYEDDRRRARDAGRDAIRYRIAWGLSFSHSLINKSSLKSYLLTMRDILWYPVPWDDLELYQNMVTWCRWLKSCTTWIIPWSSGTNHLSID